MTYREISRLAKPHCSDNLRHTSDPKTMNCFCKRMLPLSHTTISSCFSSNIISFTKPIFVRQRRNCLTSAAASRSIPSPLSGLENELMGYVFGKKKATEVAHLVWKHVLQRGDTVVDATCGNGHDTLAMLKMVADESIRGHVYGIDIQKIAIDNTSSLLDETVTPKEKELVKLFSICHSRMEDIIPENSAVRLVAFNLGYLPGGDKAIITVSETTLLALEAAKRLLVSGGLISLVVYVGHPGGRDELNTVEGFASRLLVDEWICSKFQMLNRPLAPVLVFLFKR